MTTHEGILETLIRELHAGLALAGLLARGEQRMRIPEAQDRLALEARELAAAMMRTRDRTDDGDGNEGW